MGCSSCSRTKVAKPNVVNNLLKSVSSQTNKIKWFKDGLSGLYKCFRHDTKYSDAQIVENRKACANCEFATGKQDGKLNMESQCMAIDPKTGAPCGCFLLCKTQVDNCPLNKWTPLTVSV